MLFIKIIDLLFQVYTILIFARILGSWIPDIQRYRIFQFIAFYTDPYLNLFRRIIPPLGMIDISPIFAFLCLGLLQRILESVVVSFL